jgi:hypothetical protein
LFFDANGDPRTIASISREPGIYTQFWRDYDETYKYEFDFLSTAALDTFRTFFPPTEPNTVVKFTNGQKYVIMDGVVSQQDMVIQAAAILTLGRAQSLRQLGAMLTEDVVENVVANQTHLPVSPTSIKLKPGKIGGAPNVAPRNFLTPNDFASLPRTGTIDPKAIRFSQDSIRATFQEGGDVTKLAADLKARKVSPESIRPIRIVEKDGMIFTLDNRRLKAFQEAGVPIHFEKLDTVPKNQQFKFTTKNNGTDVDIR